MNQKILNTFDEYMNENFEHAIISNSTDPEKSTKVKIRPVLLKDVLYYQATEYCGTKVFHTNYRKDEILNQLNVWFNGLFKQTEIKTRLAIIYILISKKEKVTVKVKNLMKTGDTDECGTVNTTKSLFSHNRRKNYIVGEGRKVPFLIDLGFMTEEGKIISSKYDKYRQINRFLEFIEDILSSLPKDRKLQIIDFGCGKSYLTFAMYYYLKELKGYEIHIMGLDLKEDVIKHCNELKDRYGYEDLEFIHGDIKEFQGIVKVDMVVTLHACDTATDYAIAKAVSWGADVILSVPCCQHEVNKQIKNDDLSPIFKHGLVKERMSALITDALRAELLELKGYKVQVLEFIDMEHTPKNILVRAVKNNELANQELIEKKKEKLVHCMELLNINPCLYNLFHNL